MFQDLVRLRHWLVDVSSYNQSSTLLTTGTIQLSVKGFVFFFLLHLIRMGASLVSFPDPIDLTKKRSRDITVISRSLNFALSYM